MLLHSKRDLQVWFRLWMVSKIILDYLNGPYTIIKLITKEDKGRRIRRRRNDGSRGGSNAIALKGGMQKPRKAGRFQKLERRGHRFPQRATRRILSADS